MRIIIPMAGMGKRMRPHTLTIPKPLFPIAGKPIVQRLVENLVGMTDKPIEEIAYIIGDFGKAIEDNLIQITENVKKIAANKKIKTSIYYQQEPLGTAHAILCAKDSLKDNVIIAFADTLFNTNFKIDNSQDAVVWVHKVENPSSFGVVKINKDNMITDFVEKPEEFVSDLAIIGIYYFKDGRYLKDELQYLLDNNIKDKGEYQLTNALENMQKKGSRLIPGEVTEWLDCGNKEATIHTSRQILKTQKKEQLINKSATIENSTVIHPCFIGTGCLIKNSVIGPYVCVEKNTTIEGSIISNSIIQKDTVIKDAILDNSIIGNFVKYKGKLKDLSLGDYSTMSE